MNWEGDRKVREGGGVSSIGGARLYGASTNGALENNVKPRPRHYFSEQRPVEIA